MAGVPDDIIPLLSESSYRDRYSGLRRLRRPLKLPFRQTFPLMSDLIDASEMFKFDVPKFGTKRIYVWRTKAGMPFGWIGEHRDIGREVPSAVLREHRLLYDGIGGIEERLGQVDFKFPLGCVELFVVPKYSGFSRLGPGSMAYAYLENAMRLEATSIPGPGEYVVFGTEANGDLWVYTPLDKCVYQMVLGCESMNRAGVLRQVKETPVLYRVKGGEHFTAFVEFFATRLLAKLT
jgi:hypothetical protein